LRGFKSYLKDQFEEFYVEDGKKMDKYSMKVDDLKERIVKFFVDKYGVDKTKAYYNEAILIVLICGKCQ
jgi:hypothetical protein